MTIEMTDQPVELDAACEITCGAVATNADSVPVRIEAYGGGVIDWSPLGGDVVFDLAGLDMPSELPLLIDHESTVSGQAGMGIPTNTGRAILANGTIATGTAAGKELMAGHRGGNRYQASVRLTPLKVERIAGGTGVTINGRQIVAARGGLAIVRESRLREITITPLGRDSSTRVDIAASLRGTKMNTEEIQAAIDKGVEERMTVLQSQLGEKQAKRDALLAVIGPDDPAFAKAVAEDWSVERAHLHRLNFSMPKSPLADLAASSQSGSRPRQGEMIEASLMLNAGSDGEDLKLHFGDNTIDAAMNGQMRGFGLQDLCRHVIRAAGKSVGVGGFNLGTIRAAFEADRDILAAGQSLSSLTGILSNVANKFALQGFNSVGSEWRQWCAIDSVRDFKEQSFYRLSAGTQYKELGVGEAIPSGELSEESFTNAAKTHALMLAIPREVIINDDLGMVREGARQKLGYGAGLTLAETIYGKLLDSTQVGSGQFFHTEHDDRGANYKAGADSALSVESAEEAITTMLRQLDKEGNPVDVVPRFLLTGPDLAFLADRILRDEYAPNFSSTDREPTRNAVAGRLEPLMSRYLNHASVPGGSPNTWYVLADPRALGTGAMQVVFLQGRQVPFLESSDADFNTLGIQMRGYFDFNAKLMEKACAVKMAGA